MSYTKNLIYTGYQIVCLYYINNIGITLQKLEDSDYVKFDKRAELIYFFNNYNKDEVKHIKGTLLSNKKNLLLAWITSGGVPYYYKYNIDTNDNITIQNNYYFEDSICKFKLQGFTVKYFDEKSEGEIIYTCFGENIMAKYIINNNNLDIKYSNYKYDNCSVHGLSIIYLDAKRDYYIISDADCNNKLKPLDLLFDELEDEDIIIETEQPVDYDEICGIPTTIITTIPTTIITTMPTTIITTIPSTIITTFPTTISTTILTNTIPTTFITTIPTTYSSTVKFIKFYI